MIFRPEDQWDKGKSFYFQLVLKEKDSDFVDNRYAYYCTVKMMGEELKVREQFNYTDITWKMFGEATDKKHWVDANSSTGIVWSQPVNTTFVAEHFEEMFDIFLKNVSYRELKAPMDLLSYEFPQPMHPDSMTMNMTCTFFEPYMLGLLVKKSDRLYIQMKYDILDTAGYFMPGYEHLEGMFLDRSRDRNGKLLTTLHRKECQEDGDAIDQYEGDADDDTEQDESAPVPPEAGETDPSAAGADGTAATGGSRRL
jgi:hypothetical protein